MKTPTHKTPATAPAAKKGGPFFGKRNGRGIFPGGNGFFSGAVQPKLAVGQANDSYEKQADAVADRVVRKKPIFESEGEGAEGMVHRKCAACEQEEKLQKKGEGGAPAAPAPVESGVKASRGSGSPLPESTRNQMESSIGADFSGVRVHNNRSAAAMNKSLNAQAFTSGQDIYFNAGKYDPGSVSGQHLLAHELTHVVQQQGGGVQKKIQRQPADDASGGGQGPAAVQVSPLMKSLIEWKVSGLLDPPYRPASVAPIPPIPVTPQVASYLAQGGAGIIVGNLAVDTAAVDAAAGGTGAAAGKTALEIATERWGTEAVLHSGAAGGGGTATAVGAGETATTVGAETATTLGAGEATTVAAGETAAGAGTLSELAAIAADAAPPIAFLAITLWSSPTAPAWMDEMSQVTGEPYFSPDEYTWERRLTPEQGDYLRYLTNVQRAGPISGVDDEPAQQPVPIPKPITDEKPDENGCVSMDVPRRGGHARHDAYATKVSGSTEDYYVWPGVPFMGINYDGLTSPVIVWEVKVGFGWFFNPRMASLRDIVLARFDVQKNLGMAIALKCGYIHLWTIPDKWVAGLLNTRWGGVPPVLSIPE